MRRFLPYAIIGVVFLVAIGSGMMLFRAKQPSSAPIAPIPPVVPATTPVIPAPSPVAAAASPVIAAASPVAAGSPPAVPAAPIAPIPPVSQMTTATSGKPEALHFRGGANAPVTLEEYGDFQCLPCAEIFPILLKMEADYGEQLRVVFRHKPLHKHEHAVLAARAAEAAGLQGHFWEMHDLLFQNSLRWTKGIDTVGPDASPTQRMRSKVLAMDIEVRDVFASYAQRLQLDVERFKTDLDSDEIKARVESDRALGDSLKIDRTPTVYLNGRLLPFLVQTLDGLHAAIEAELNGPRQNAPAATPGQPK
jgi:protein-disulfide isomerase